MNTFLSADQASRNLPMSMAIELMREAFTLISSGKAVIPVRQNLAIKNFSGNNLIMPCYLPACGYYGIKIVNVFIDNRQRNLPTIQSIYHLFDEKNGSLLISLDGAMLTKIRTAAASGLATQLMAKKDSSVLAIFGTGIQAESHIEAICNVSQIKEILVYSRHRKNAQMLIDKVSVAHPCQYFIASTGKDLKKADIICTTTPSKSALFKKEELKPSAHINAIGSYMPDMIEIPIDVVSDSLIVVDQYEGAFNEAGEIIQALDKGIIKKDSIFCELGELLTEKKSPRFKSMSFTLFKSVGNALQDLVCAKYLYENTK